MYAHIREFLFTNKTAKQTIAKNSFWLFASESFGRLLKMALVIYAARVLGANGWGVFSYALSIGSLIMLFSDIGLANLIARDAVQKKENYRAIITAAFLMKGFLLLVSMLLVIFLGPTISHIPEARALFPFVGLIFLFDSLRELGFSINRASEKMEREMIVKTIMNLVILALGVALLMLRTIPQSIMIAYVIGSLIGCICILFVIRNEIKTFIGKTNRHAILLVWQTTWPLALVTLIGSIMANTDVYMLGIWRNATEIGLYSSVQRIQQFIIMIPATLATASFPLLSQLAHADKKQFSALLEKTTAIIMMVGMPIAIGGIMLANKLIPFIFGPGYLEAVPIMQILMVMLLASFPLVMLSNAVFAHNKQRNLALAYAFGVIANVILNLLLIPKFGAVGSALATLFSTSIITLTIARKLNDIEPYSVLPKLGKVFAATIIMAFCIVLLIKLDLNVLIIILISALIYCGMLVILKDSLVREMKSLLGAR